VRPARPASLLLVLLLTAACAGASPQPLPGDASGSAAQVPPAERLFLLDAAGFHEVTAGERKLLVARPEGAFIYDAAASPDGSTVALSIQLPPKQTPTGYDFGLDLYVARPGEQPAAIVRHERIAETMSQPNWLPDGDKLLLAVLGRDETGAADPRIELIDIATGTRQRFVEDALEPALSPDGSHLAYVGYDPATGIAVLMVRDLATGESRPLLPDDQVMSNVANIAWSPDGTRLAFAAADPIGLGSPALGRSAAFHPTLRDVWLVNLDGTGLKRITELADASLALAWSADNRHIYALGDTGFWRLDSTSGDLVSIGDPIPSGRVQTLLP
jgi:dipeptidyl aminopeptidase/acylaminoacyl peptidase